MNSWRALHAFRGMRRHQFCFVERQPSDSRVAKQGRPIFQRNRPPPPHLLGGAIRHAGSGSEVRDGGPEGYDGIDLRITHSLMGTQCTQRCQYTSYPARGYTLSVTGQSFSERLAWARKKAGFPSAREAARALEWNENTYKSHENGMRGTDRAPQEAARKYARAFGVSLAWLLTGEGKAESQRPTPVIGRIGAGAEIMPEFEQVPPEGLFLIETTLPLPEDSIAFEVEGTSMWPRYDPGDVIVCSAAGTTIEEVLGFQAAVRTADGRRFLKRVVSGATPGRYDLESLNADTLRNVELEWVSPVTCVFPAAQWRRLDRAAIKRAYRRAISSTEKRP